MALGHARPQSWGRETEKGKAMLYSEAAYFDGAHVAHIAAYYDHLRLKRLRAQARLVIERRTGSRARG